MTKMFKEWDGNYALSICINITAIHRVILLFRPFLTSFP